VPCHKRPSAVGGGGPHAIGGSTHTSSTLVEVNTKLSDAVLDDHGDARPPLTHSHPESDVVNLTTDLSARALASDLTTHANLTTTAHGGLIASSEKAAVSGVASLDGSSQLVQAVANGAIGDAKLRNSGGTSVIGRSAGTTGAPADIQATADDQYLRRSAGVLGFGALPASGGGARAVTFVVGDGLNVITTGPQGVFPQIPFAGTISRWTLVADIAGSLVLDVWKTTYAGAPPTDGNTITGSEKPTLAGIQKNEDTTLTTWTTTVAAGDVLGFEVESAATVKRATLTIWVTPT